MRLKIFKSKKHLFPDRKILLVSLQKCGTHLIERILDAGGLKKVPYSKVPCALSEFAGLQNSNYIRTAFAPAVDVQMALEDNKGVYIIFNYRDPRDVLVSWFHWVHPSNTHTMHSHMGYMQKVYASFSDDELIDMFINNDKFRADEYNPIEAFRLSRVLLYHPKVLKVRFEELIGPQGGGELSLQTETINRIYDYLGITDVNANEVANKIFSKDSPTFRKGKIGSYKDFLSTEQLDKFYRLHGNILKQYGYS